MDETIGALLLIAVGLVCALVISRFSVRLGIKAMSIKDSLTPGHECVFRLEGIMDSGSVVEICDRCADRRMYLVSKGEPVKCVTFTKKEWESDKWLDTDQS